MRSSEQLLMSILISVVGLVFTHMLIVMPIFTVEGLVIHGFYFSFINGVFWGSIGAKIANSL